MHIAVAADHNGLPLKAELVRRLAADGHDVIDRGSHLEGVVDYPLLCFAVCRLVVSGEADWGLVIGGSGQGEVIACNKVRGIRAGLGYSTFAAEISRGNNDANVLVLGAKVVTPELAFDVITTWLETPFRGGVHQARLDQIAALESRPYPGEDWRQD
ncbi:RpiB/LacA/LacB family sugar-phosphate isomerase [Nocardioides agariphilus]|uniref:RpiB/LacA/LacB family sugar-phosphate isomerase n=1 Tax=Nocardioides agariphilus TaxID=433664 RepID=A0A930VPE5_9ACTN|nr:RpiB/LacA/LacB family sugar-phosphate isomerase [Nocardioides agariphilus]